MEIQILFQLMVFILGLLLLGFIHQRWFSKFLNNKRKAPAPAPPQPAGAWPVIGHIRLLLGGNKLAHRILSDMADIYGPIFSLRMGFHETAVINNFPAAKECFTTKDRIFSTRPKGLAFKLMTYDQTVIAFAPYGPNWRAMRKFVVLNLLTTHRLHQLRHVRFTEIDFILKSLYQQWNQNGGKDKILVEFKNLFSDMSSNIITRIIAGKRFAGGAQTDESRQCKDAITRMFHLFGLFLISDAIPFLGWLDVLNGNCGKMKRAAKEIDGIIGRWLEEHREERRLKGCIDEDENDLIHVMLSDLQDGDLATVGYDTDTILKSMSMAMILGGNDTISVSMTWVMCFILNNRDVMCKAQEELDTHVGRGRKVEESDVKNLVYLQAIFKESMRLQPTFPLLLVREAMEDCNLGGFEIKAGTRLLINVWKIHREPSVWSEPLEFKPERFLGQDNNFDFGGKNLELLPFGSGRRVCPGITFSLQVMHLAMARILQGFELDTIDGLPVDMTEGPGLSVPKATPLKVLISPRLSHHLYM